MLVRFTSIATGDLCQSRRRSRTFGREELGVDLLERFLFGYSRRTLCLEPSVQDLDLVLRELCLLTQVIDTAWPVPRRHLHLLQLHV